MNNSIVTLSHISKNYGKAKILSDLNINICKGAIYGFIGQNGAGKTTTLKIIAGLTDYHGGEFTLLGEKTNARKRIVRNKLGSLIENPVLYSSMTAYQNMKVHCLQRGIATNDIEHLLEYVSLKPNDRTKTIHYSLGMKQRLGIAIALLGNIELVILDEPINGLDPTGIIEFRELITKLSTERGITVLISSHILSELYQIATDFAFIKNGTILKELSKNELDQELSRHSQSIEDYYIKLMTNQERKF